MAKEVRIVTFIDDREGREDGEKTMSELVNRVGKLRLPAGATGLV